MTTDHIPWVRGSKSVGKSVLRKRVCVQWTLCALHINPSFTLHIKISHVRNHSCIFVGQYNTAFEASRKCKMYLIWIAVVKTSFHHKKIGKRQKEKCIRKGLSNFSCLLIPLWSEVAKCFDKKVYFQFSLPVLYHRDSTILKMDCCLIAISIHVLQELKWFQNWQLGLHRQHFEESFDAG